MALDYGQFVMLAGMYTPASFALSGDTQALLLSMLAQFTSAQVYADDQALTEFQRDVIDGVIDRSVRELMINIGIGTIMAGCWATPPANCLACDGATYNDAQYPLLGALIAPAFRVSATQFRVPDLRGQTIIGAGSSVGGVPSEIGATGGAYKHQLLPSEMPAHTHPRNQSDVGEYALLISTTPTNGRGVPNGSGAWIVSDRTGAAGGSVPHNNLQPSIALSYVIVAR